MCLSIRQMDPKSRLFFAISDLSLAIGLLLRLFVRPTGLVATDWLDGVSGLLIGISIGINLFALRHVRRNRVIEPGQL